MGWWVAAVVAATIVTVAVRPRGIGEAWPAAAGAGAMLALGAVGPADLAAAARESADVLLFLLGMMVLTGLAEQAGVFDRLAEQVARLARGSGVGLLTLVVLLAAVVTALLSLDVTVLLLTPVVFALTTRRRLDAMPFMFACTFVANTGSLVLPVSNLTNLLVYSRLDLGFAEFAGRMALPGAAAVAANLAVFLLLFRNRLPARFEAPPADLPPVDRWLVAAALVLAATTVGLLAAGLLGRPLAWPALAGGATLLVVGLADRRVRLRETVAAVSWPLFVYVLGMLLIVRGFERVWLTDLAIRLPEERLPALLAAVGIGAVGGNVVNNVPVTLLVLPLIERADGVVREALAYGTLVGANIGPTLTTYGSLATMLWLALMRQRGHEVSAIEYMKVALLTTPIVLLAATLALWLVLR